MTKFCFGIQIVIGLWGLANGFMIGEIGWSYSIGLWVVSAFLLLGGFGYFSGAKWWKVTSFVGFAGIDLGILGFFIFQIVVLKQGNSFSAFDLIYSGILLLYSNGMMVYLLKRISEKRMT